MSQTGAAPNQSNGTEGPTPAEKLVAADALCRAGKLEEGHAALSELIAQHPATGEAVTAARALWRYGWPDEALDALPRIVARSLGDQPLENPSGVILMAVSTVAHLGSDDEISARLTGPNLFRTEGIRPEAVPFLWRLACLQMIDSLGKRECWMAVFASVGNTNLEMVVRVKAASLLIAAKGQSFVQSMLSDEQLPAALKAGSFSVLRTVLPIDQAITTLKGIARDSAYDEAIRRAARVALGNIVGADVAAIVVDRKHPVAKRQRAIALLSEPWQTSHLLMISTNKQLDLDLRLDACHRLLTDHHIRDAAVWMVAEVVSKHTRPALRDAYEQFLREHGMWEDVVVDLALVSQYRERRAR